MATGTPSPTGNLGNTALYAAPSEHQKEAEETEATTRVADCGHTIANLNPASLQQCAYCIEKIRPGKEKDIPWVTRAAMEVLAAMKAPDKKNYSSFLTTL